MDIDREIARLEYERFKVVLDMKYPPGDKRKNVYGAYDDIKHKVVFRSQRIEQVQLYVTQGNYMHWNNEFDEYIETDSHG